MGLLLAVAVSAGVALAGWFLRALTPRGALAATAVGTSVLWAAGWPGFAVLGTYFAGTTLVSRLSSSRSPLPEQADREARDARQVAANGGVAGLAALLASSEPALAMWLVTMTLAAAGADTWATAVGGLSPRPPRDLLRSRQVAPGTSGGVTWFGTSGGLMGAALIGLAGTVMTGSETMFLAAAATGLAGMLVDSALGSGVQAVRHCQTCDQPTERSVHRCGQATTLTRGIRWIDNDVVNAFATGFGALLGLALWAAGAR